MILAHRLDAGLAVAPAQAKADARAAAGAGEWDEDLDETNTEGIGGERRERDADKTIWLRRPISALAAQICRGLNHPFDAALWGEDIPRPLPHAAPAREHATAGALSSGARRPAKLGSPPTQDERD